MTLSINPDIPFFDNSSGRPVSLGTAYFGLPNQDPKLFPSTNIFSDSGFNTSISAVQPLDSAGKLPKFVYLDAPYSLLVEDSSGNQVLLNNRIELTEDSFVAVNDKQAIIDLNPRSFPFATALGHSQVGDNGGFSAYFVEGSVEPVNPFVFADSGNTGRWFVISQDGYFNVKWAGVKQDGTTDNSAALQAAENALSDGGGLIYPNDNGLAYSFSGQVDFTSSNVTHKGVGNPVLKISDNYPKNRALFFVPNLVGVKFDSITFDGNKDNQSITSLLDAEQICIQLNGACKNITTTGCHYKEWGKDGFYIDGPCDNISVANQNIFENIRRNGVTIIGGENINIHGNSFFNSAAVPFSVLNYGIDIEANNSSQIVSGCNVYGNIFDSLAGGFAVANANQAAITGLSINNNVFRDITANGAMILTAESAADHMLVNNNVFERCGNFDSSTPQRDGCITARNARNAQICNNIFKDCRGFFATIALTGNPFGNLVAGNTFINDQRRAVYAEDVFNSNITGTKRSIVNNTMINGSLDSNGNFPAIDMQNSATHPGIGDIIIGNNIRTGTTGTNYPVGIRVFQDSGSTIAKNIITGSGSKYDVTGPSISLDSDYRDTEGTFQPQIFGSTSASNEPSYSIRTGTYQILGKKVFYNFRVSISSIASVTGNLTVNLNGLTVSRNVSNLVYSCSIGFANNTILTSGTQLQASIGAGTNVVDLREVSPTGAQRITSSQISNNFDVAINGFYFL